MTKKLLLQTMLSCLACIGFTQNIGDWRLHFTYANAIDLTASENEVFAATEKALLIYDIEDGTIQTLDKANALSDIGVSNIDYVPDLNALIIAYNSSNIDLKIGNSIINIPDIKNKLTSGSKNINEIFVYNEEVYLSTDFGIVLLDVVNREIDDTYVIGNTGDPVVVYDCSIYNDTIFALTAQGLKTAPLSSPNLLDFNSWTHNNVFYPFGFSTMIEQHNGKLFSVVNETMYEYVGSGTWDSVYRMPGFAFQSLQSSEKLTFTLYNNDASDRKVMHTNDGVVFDTVALTRELRPTASLHQNGVVYVADVSFGLLRHTTSTSVIQANSLPFKNTAFRGSSNGSKVFVSSGAISRNTDPVGLYNGFYIFDNNKWQNVNQFTTTGYPVLQDVIDVKQNPVDGKVYATSAKGMIEYDFQTAFLHDRTNSPIDSIIGNGSFDLISGVGFDKAGNTWIANVGTNDPLLVKTRQGDWYEYPLAPVKYNNLFVDNDDQKWLTVRGSGIYIFKENEIENTTTFDLVQINGSRIPNNNVNAIAQDKNGEVWIGTDQGVAVFDCPEDILIPTSGCQTSRKIKATLNSVFTATEFLFETDIVKAIAVDGANRKWVGTESGVWLLTESGEDEILNFNTENSPLPSNTISDITINEATGEVFILTDLGMASYFSDATEPSENHDEIKAYPNPVRPEYTGFISITGLVADSYVKIVDNAGVLIDEGFALGGKYIWDGNNYNGKRAKTGIYYVFSANPNGTEKAVTKIAVVN